MRLWQSRQAGRQGVAPPLTRRSKHDQSKSSRDVDNSLITCKSKTMRRSRTASKSSPSHRLKIFAYLERFRTLNKWGPVLARGAYHLRSDVQNAAAPSVIIVRC